MDWSKTYSDDRSMSLCWGTGIMRRWILGLLENCEQLEFIFVPNFWFRHAKNLVMTTQHFGKFRRKIKIMSAHSVWSEICSCLLEFCRIFAMLIATSCPAYFYPQCHCLPPIGVQGQSQHLFTHKLSLIVSFQVSCWTHTVISWRCDMIDVLTLFVCELPTPACILLRLYLRMYVIVYGHF